MKDRIDKPWGHEEIVEHNDRYVIKKLIIHEGHRLSLQYHKEKHETLVLFSGLVLLKFGKTEGKLDEEIMHPGFVKVIEPGMIHQIAAMENSIIIECSTTELDDVVRLRDDYGRT